MRLLRDCILPITLGLILAPSAWAGDDDKKAANKQGEEQTIRGVVSEVTLLGETDIDYRSRKAITAEATFLTVIGHPSNHQAMHKEGAQASADKDKDKDVKRTANASSISGERPRHRMNVYVVAISPKTKVCEVKEAGKDSSASAKEQACDLDRLEIGDRVEVSFTAKMMRGSDDAKGDSKASSQKHGRHRVYFGDATAIKIMFEPMENEHSASHERK